jgi:signal peptidase I
MYGACVVAGFTAQPFRPFVVVGDSMEPTYHNGELIIARQYRGEELAKDQLVVMDVAGDTIVKRVAHVQGDQVRQVNLGVWTEGVSEHAYEIAKRKGIYRSFVVPENEVYVLGDNSACAIDSRQLGSLPLSSVRLVVMDPRPKPVFPDYLFRYPKGL